MQWRNHFGTYLCSSASSRELEGGGGSKKVAIGNGNRVKTLRPDEECALRMPRVEIRRLTQLPS